MPDTPTDAQPFQETKLAVLFSLGWRVLWLPLGILFPLPSLLRHPKILVFACATYAVIVVWKLAAASRWFHRMDLLTLLFCLLSSYAAGFVVFLFWLVYVRPPEPTDLIYASALYIMGMTFVSVGLVMLVSPKAATRLNELADGKVRPGEQRLAFSPRSWRMRIGGAFLTGTGALLLAVAVKVTMEAVGVWRY